MYIILNISTFTVQIENNVTHEMKRYVISFQHISCGAVNKFKPKIEYPQCFTEVQVERERVNNGSADPAPLPEVTQYALDFSDGQSWIAARCRQTTPQILRTVRVRR